jgi:hypothetical protein
MGLRQNVRAALTIMVLAMGQLMLQLPAQAQDKPNPVNISTNAAHLTNPTVSGNSNPANTRATGSPAKAALPPVNTTPQNGKRMALVIGNNAYQKIVSLKNARNDANLMANTLRRAGFDVTQVSDLARDGPAPTPFYRRSSSRALTSLLRPLVEDDQRGKPATKPVNRVSLRRPHSRLPQSRPADNCLDEQLQISQHGHPASVGHRLS